MLLVGGCEWLLFFFSRNKLFLEILSSGDYRKMLASQNFSVDFHISKLDSFGIEYSSVFVLSCTANDKNS